MPTAPAAWITPVPSQVHSLRLEKQEAASIAIDETYLYWLPYPGWSQLLRYPLAGGKVETIATSRFTRFGDGYLASLGLLRRGDWLIFTDSREYDNSVWTVRALNVKTGQEQVVVDEPGDPVSWPGADYAADGDWVVWTRTGHPKDANCDQSILAVRNLKSGELRELDRVCTAGNYMWVFPKLSGDKIVVEQDLPDSKGGGSDLYLFDLSTGKRTALTDNRNSSMPAMSGKWLVWKNGPRFSHPDVPVIYDLTNGQRRSMQPPFDQPTDPWIAGHWLYWQPIGGRPFVVYDLETGQFLTIATPGANESFDSVAIYNNVAAWSRNLDFGSGKPSDHILEWRTLR